MPMGKGDSTHLIDGMTLNAYARKGNSAHLIVGMTLSTYEGKGDFAHLSERGSFEHLLL